MIKRICACCLAGARRFSTSLQAVAAAQQRHVADTTTSETLAIYQRLNMRNFLMIMQASQYSIEYRSSSVHVGDLSEGFADASTDSIRCFLQSSLRGNRAWADICPCCHWRRQAGNRTAPSQLASGADCLTDGGGTVDELLSNPVPMGNILDYGADPTGSA